MLNAEESQFTAELQLVSAQRLEAGAIVGLYMALGGGWEAADKATVQANESITQGPANLAAPLK